MLKRLFKHRHKWQTRATNRWFNTTYRVCLKCKKCEQWEGGPNGHFEECDPIPEFDKQFDEKGNYIFS